MENSTYKNKYYEKSLYISLVFVSLLPLIIILGILILHFSEALDSLGYFLLICGSIFELVSLMLLLSSLTRRLVLFDDGFVWFVYSDTQPLPQKQKICFFDIREITETVNEYKQPSFLLVLLSLILFSDFAGGIKNHSVFTLHLKNGDRIYTRFDGFSQEIQDMMTCLLDQKVYCEQNDR